MKFACSRFRSVSLCKESEGRSGALKLCFLNLLSEFLLPMG